MSDIMNDHSENVEKIYAGQDDSSVPSESATSENEKGKNDPEKAPLIINEYIGEVEGNILDTVDLPTYHLKLYMIGPGSKNTSAGSETGTSEDTEVSSSEDARQDQSPGSGNSESTGATGYLNNRMDSDDPSDTVVLAETGVTEVGIDGLEIATVPSGGGGSIASTVNFTITQPNAADFPDQIVKARTYLGAPADAMDCPLFLEVSFRGRKESNLDFGDAYDVDKGGEIIKNVAGPFVYPLLLSNFSMEITEAGSTYEFETVVKDDLYTADAFFRTSKMYTITGRTIGNMLKDLENQTNDYNLEQGKPQRISFGLEEGTASGGVAGAGGAVGGAIAAATGEESSASIKQNYNVPGLEHIINQTLDIEDTETTAKVTNLAVTEKAQEEGTEGAEEEAKAPRENKSSINKNPETNMIELTLKEGMDMSRVLGLLLSMNKEFMQKATRATDVEDPSKEETEATKQICWYEFHGSLEYLEYNLKEKQYYKLAHLKPYTFMSDKTDIAVFPWEVDKNNNLSKDETTTRVNQMKIRKAYEYIFTGRNDQILSCNIQFNEGIALLLPPDRGLLGDVSLNAASVLKSTPVDKNEELDEKGIEKLTEAAQDENGGSFFDQLKKVKENIEKGEAYLKEIGSAAGFTESKIKDLLTNSNGAAAKELEEALSKKETAQAIADGITAQRKATNQANVVTQSEEFSPSQSGFVYGGDLIGDTKYAEQIASGGQKFKDDRKSEDQPEPSKEHTDGVAQRKKFEYKTGFSNVGTTKGIKNNLFTYLYDQHQAIEFLMRLEMQLRGDPWWLGRPVHRHGTTKNPVGFTSQQLKETDEDGNNYLTTTTDNFFLFSLNSPRLFDPDVENEDNNTGLWIKEGDGTSYFISGIYLVRNVMHKFDNGVYTMDIMGVKETAISLNNMQRDGNFRYIDENRTGFTAKKQDGVVTDADREGGTDTNTQQPSHRYVQGALAANEDATPESLLEDQKITKEQYDAYVSWKKEADAEEQRRRGRG